MKETTLPQRQGVAQRENRSASTSTQSGYSQANRVTDAADCCTGMQLQMRAAQ